MGFIKFDSDRDELRRERSRARLARDRDRRQAREHKHTPAPVVNAVWPALPPQPASPRAGVGHDQPMLTAAPRPHAPVPVPPAVPVLPVTPQASATPGKPVKETAVLVPVSRRELDIAQFRNRREQLVREARAEAARWIAHEGEFATVRDALAAIRDPQAACWAPERARLEEALTAGPRDTAHAARTALHAVSRDAARTTRRTARDPELAFAVCVAYALVLRLARTAVRIEHRDQLQAPAWTLPRPFWH